GQRRRVELDRGVARAGVRGGEGLERLEVGRRDHERAPLGELLEDRLGERGPLVRVGPRAQLVEEHERALAGLVEDLADLLHECREGREVLRDRLVVADDRVKVSDDWKARAFPGRAVATMCGSPYEERRRFQRDRLASRVRTGDQEQGTLSRQLD